MPPPRIMKAPVSKLNRSLPTLVVLPVPASYRYGRHPHKTYPLPNQGDGHKQAVVHSLDSLCAIIDLTLSFLDSKTRSEYLNDVKDWLRELRGNLDAVEDAMQCGCFDNGTVTIDTEGPSDLDNVLCSQPDPEGYQRSLNSVTQRMLSFWLDEVERRGWELFNICIESVDCVRALELFRVTLTMTPVYMHK
jgi:hypothetical protein